MKLQIRLVTFLLVFFITKTYAQPEVSWASNIVGQGYDETFDVALDTFGNVFICGQIEFTSYFSGFPSSTAGIHDIYLAKYDRAGNLLWVRREGGVGGDKAISVAVDLAGNAFIVGEYEEDFNFGSTYVEADAGNNMFVAKYDSAGHFKWVKTLQGGGETVRGFAVAVDDDGNVYAGGIFHEDAEYDGTRLFSTRGSKDVIIVKFSPTGHLIWSERIGDSHTDEIWGLAIHEDKMYVTGSFDTKTKFGSTSVTSYGDADFYIAQYDTAGNFNWAKHGGSSGIDEGLDVTVNSNGDVICTGYFESTATFSGTTLTSMGNTDVFVNTYDAAGTLLWAKKFGGTGFDRGSGIVNDKQRDIFFTGSYEGVAVFDSIHPHSSGGIDIFVAKCDQLGNLEFVKSVGGPGNERGRSCAVDKFENIYVNNEYWNYIDLDSLHLTGQLLIDACLFRIGNYPVCSASASVTSQINCYNQCDGAVTVTATGQSPFAYSWTAGSQTTDSVYNLCPGTYYAIITDAFGCTATDTVLLLQPAPISVSNALITNESCIGCNDGQINVTITGGTAPYNYSWADGSTSEDRMNLVTGTYILCVSDSNSCNFCDTFFVGNTMIGINDIDQSSEFSIYNDIQHSHLYITSSRTVQGKYSLTSATGKRIAEGSINSTNVDIDLNNYSTGLYMLTIESEKGRWGKFVVKM